MTSYLLNSEFDSEDERIVALIQELQGEDGEVESSERVPRSRIYIPRDREKAAENIWRIIFVSRPCIRNINLKGVFVCVYNYFSEFLELAYGTAADMFDEYLKMSEQTSVICLDNFCKCIIHLYKERYMRSLNAYDVERLFSKHEEKHGFKGMLWSIDCMHWEWKNCPVSLKGKYTRGDHKKPTIMLEAVASYDL
ncbi:uncharacterized protein [Rutidosis leptorrhynchoides]|uniref:uncharacterized protein n=1 Tax=Rutidosis leptorrhynchoides TaxID=125765 RepID=UPI003A99BBF6